MNVSPGALPELLVSQDGQAVTALSQWPARRAEILRLSVPLAYGAWPGVPHATRGELLHAATVRHLGDARLWTLRVLTDGDTPSCCGCSRLRVRVRSRWSSTGMPAGTMPVTSVIAAMLHRGYAFAQFNRVEIAADMPGPPPAVGALAAWAWGYHRALDALLPLAWVDPARASPWSAIPAVARRLCWPAPPIHASP
jgi:hypothetical protein